MSAPGKNNLITDIDGIQVGNAHDAAAKTGSSVIVCDPPCVGAVAVAGGGPGTRETDLLDADKLVEQVNAITLSGGSAYGLAAADGVAAALGARGQGFAMVDRPDVPKTPIVPGAILYDLANGGDKAWGETPPYRALGQSALAAATDGAFPLGAAGAGYGAACRTETQVGSAPPLSSRDDGIDVRRRPCRGEQFRLCLYAGHRRVLGLAVRDRSRVWRGPAASLTYRADAEDWGAAKQNPQPGENTTIACIATDVALTPGQAKRVAQHGAGRHVPRHPPCFCAL